MTDPQHGSDPVDLSAIPTLDLTTLTLGEMAAVEAESGRSFDALLRAGNATKRLLALWVAEHRLPSSGPRRSWQELSNLRPLASSSSPLQSTPAGRPSPSRD
jgi:hypothetical protein